MTTTVAASLINAKELWKIVLAALIGGTGAVTIFGLMLLGVSRGRAATRSTIRYGLFTLSCLCGAVVVAIAAAGVYAMTQKPSAAKPKPRAARAVRRAEPPAPVAWRVRSSSRSG